LEEIKVEIIFAWW